MIEVKIYETGYTITGHAGESILCSAVSAVTQMIAYEVTYREYGGYTMEYGHIQVDFHYKYKDVMRPYLNMLTRTLQAWEAEYPEKIHVEVEL